jgi:hypothetical protein
VNQAVDNKSVAQGAIPVSAIDKGAFRDRLLILSIAAFAFGAWYIGKLKLYEPDSPLAYNLGLVGGIAMALLLFYPLRKRVRFMRSLLPLKYWFGAHMALGVFGPVLIMYHSNFQLHSKNGAVAFYSMMAVFLSGLVGRVIYRRIHQGLFGRKLTLEELKARMGMSGESIHSRFQKLPKIEQRLQRYEQRAMDENVSSAKKLFRALTLRPYSFWVKRSCLAELKKAINKVGKKKNWSRAERSRRYMGGRSFINSYVEAVNKVTQFGVFERMFSIWHIAHVPLIFLLLVTAIIHVIAVHMY